MCKNCLMIFQPEKTRFSWETTTTPKGPTTTEDIVIFEKNKPVSLEIPDQLFGSSFTLVTNLSNTVGDFMIVKTILTIYSKTSEKTCFFIFRIQL